MSKMVAVPAHAGQIKHSSSRSRQRKRMGYRCFTVEAHRTDILNLQDAGILPQGELTVEQIQEGLQEAFRRSMALVKEQAVQAMRDRHRSASK